jgi:hypothetical protein
MYFVFDGEEARLTKNIVKGKEIGIINNTKIIYSGDRLYMFNRDKDKKETPAQLFPLLKSNLQKQVRRGELESIITASIMLDLNDFELLSIIAGEDVELSVETSVIVWYMTAVSKGLILSPLDKEFILNYVYSCTIYPKCRRLELKNFDLLYLKGNELHPDREKIDAILFRNCFGGLCNDLPMMDRLCKDFLYSGNRLKSILQIRPILNAKLKILDSAIDFHIYPNLITLIEQDTKISPEVIKKTIWECSSRINFRFPEITSLQPIWEKIEPSFNYHTKVYLSKIIKRYF